LFLKKLEIHGFKSFADKTELLFEPGITAVVGPNGCGKTNVSDSLRWVLGEQSTKGLRATDMTQVIFNGTDQRKPSAFAEVTLIMTNEDHSLPLDYNEIAITRRLFRSGESEYLINRAPARLKDVRELFMGTGVGVSAYSILAQGQMDAIITAKPTERRAIFEEAAGITKYKARKAEAMRKLDSTEQNLVRVADIIAELERQIASLERQARQAERFRNFKETLSKLQIQLQLHKRLSLQESLKALHNGMHEVKGRWDEVHGAASTLEHEEKRLRSTLAEMEDALSREREQAYKVDSEVEVAQGRVEGARQHKGILSERRTANEKEILESEAKLEQLHAWIAERRKVVESQEADKKEKLERRGTLEGQASSLDSELNVKNRFLEDKNNVSVDLVARTAQMKAELDSLKSQEEEAARQAEAFTQNVGRIDGELQRQKTLGEERQTERTQVQEEDTHLSEDSVNLQARFSTLSLQIEESAVRIAASRDELSQVRSRYNVLEELKNKLTGYDPGIKVLLQAKQTEPLMWQGILGVVADLVSVDQVRETGVEALLGGQLQSLVVDTREVAEKVVAKLKADGEGKVSLLVLEDLASLQPVPLPEEVLTDPGVQGEVSVSVRRDPTLDPVVRFLFEQDVFVKDNETAMRLSQKFTRLSFVTPEGDRVGPWGSWKSGSAVSGVSLLGRHREMSELAEKRNALEAQLEIDETAQSEAKREAQETQNNRNGIEVRLQKLKVRRAELEQELGQISTTLARLEGERKEIERDRSALESRRSESSHRQDELSGLLAQSEHTQNLTQEEIAVARAALQDLQSRKDELARQVMQVSMELENLEETARRAREEADRYQSERDQLSVLVGQKRQENQSLESQDGQLSLALSDLEQKIAALSGRKNESDSGVKAAQEKRDVAAREVEGHADHLRQAREKQETVQNELHQLEVQEAQMAVEMRNIEEKLQVEHKVDLANPPVEVGEGFSDRDAEEKIIELRAKIERLGLVNMVAMEEYEELTQRFKFLTEQREDLIRAKEDLQKAIHKINLTTKEMFSSTFATVQEHFKDIFQRLFEGGRAELILIDEGDVLESGIEIVARPPGKRLQSVSLLSGGEKALTAIALLFALFMVKPSPFCVLDEIDAPLDEVNVGRYTHLLKEFSKRTQFIVITHNKVTMETGDSIYGVTMQESGVSRVVSAKFKENNPDVEAAKV
jgi:chromosome segregation protein